MIRPDIIISWPRNCDYPLWRQYVHDYRANFNEIIVVFTETHHGEDYREFIRESFFKDAILTVDSPIVQSGEDWRNVAVHAALLHSYNAPWVFFTEQDFFIKDGFWDFINTENDKENYDVYAVMDGPRMHPCGILMRRETLNITEKQFGIVPNKSDHFSLIQRDIENKNNLLRTRVIPQDLYYHMNGLSHNLTLMYNNAEVTYQPEAFREYLGKSLKVSVPLDPRYVSLVTSYLSPK